MILKRLDVTRVRNIREERLELAAGLNVIAGANGSGKTSLLEATYLLGTGQSFRTQKPQSVISHGEPDMVVFGLGVEDGLECRIGVKRGRNGSREILIDGRQEASRGRLAKLLPMTVITPESHRLVNGGPAERRAFLDWVVFHVEHGFHEAWSNYQRALKQRNELLRRGAGDRELSPWEEMLGRAGETLHRLRTNVIGQLAEDIIRYAAAIEPEVEAVTLGYAPGWDTDRPLTDVLKENRTRDSGVGHTTAGPHRADLDIRSAGVGAATVLSRGQEKGLVVSMKLAGIEALVRHGSRTPALLFDDLPSELDETKRRLVMEAVAGFGCQTLVTATDAHSVPMADWPTAAMFHVEQGRIHKLV